MLQQAISLKTPSCLRHLGYYPYFVGETSAEDTEGPYILIQASAFMDCSSFLSYLSGHLELGMILYPL